jgi:hypothetical protein
MLLDYLNALMATLPQLYNQPEYRDIHSLHLGLIVEHVRKQPLPDNASSHTTFSSSEELMCFLKYSKNVEYQTSLDACLSLDPVLLQPAVYSLTQMRRYSEALSLLLQYGGCARDAIAFVESNDEELWKLLVDYSFQSPTFLKDLLDNTGSDLVRASELIKDIPLEMITPAIRTSIELVMTRAVKKVRCYVVMLLYVVMPCD